MCRLLGVVGNREVDVVFSFVGARRSFVEQSRSNPDGWGIGWFEGGVPRVFKESLPLYLSDMEVVRSVRSRVIVAHVRFATHGGRSLENTHPFVYGGYLFAHNGVVDRSGLLELLEPRYRGLLRGETDSEALFYYIVQTIEDVGDVVGGIVEAVRSLVERGVWFTSLNSLLATSDALYVLRYARSDPSYYTLYVLRRPSGTDLEVLSRETRMLVISKLRSGEEAVIVASEEMTEEDWRPIRNKSLLVIDRDLEIKQYRLP